MNKYLMKPKSAIVIIHRIQYSFFSFLLSVAMYMLIAKLLRRHNNQIKRVK
jgi:predicted Co/Zn/Cd cation transporter (cation efflux family)